MAFFFCGRLRACRERLMNRTTFAPPAVPQEPTVSLSARVARAGALALGWAIGGVAVLVGAVRCPSARWLHVPCPGCGMQRAVLLFLHGDFAGSIAMNALAVPITLAILGFASASVLLTLTRGSAASLFQSRFARIAVRAFVVLEVLSVILWALRFGGLFGGPVSV
jgi:hypothetical protein